VEAVNIYEPYTLPFIYMYGSFDDAAVALLT